MSENEKELTQETEEISAKPEKEPHKLILILAPIALLAGSFFLVRTAMDKVVANAMEAFKTSEGSMTETAYDKAIEAFKLMVSEETYSASSITITPVRQQERVEVYRVPAEEYVIEKKDDNPYGITSWMRMSGTGIYTVDLSLSEFIVDSQNSIVTVIIPELQLEYDMGEGKENIDQLLFRQDIPMPADTDETKAAQQIEERMIHTGRRTIRDVIKKDEEYTDKAKEAASSIITSLIESLNPDREIHVIVEFAEDEED